MSGTSRSSKQAKRVPITNKDGKTIGYVEPKVVKEVDREESTAFTKSADKADAYLKSIGL